jgi:hypothetical protein
MKRCVSWCAPHPEAGVSKVWTNRLALRKESPQPIDVVTRFVIECQSKRIVRATVDRIGSIQAIQWNRQLQSCISLVLTSNKKLLDTYLASRRTI